MGINQNLLLQILSAAIRNSAIELDASYYEWSGLLNIANRHQITALLYPVIKRLNNASSCLENKVFDVWKNISVESAIRKKIEIEGFTNTLASILKTNKKIVLLKGVLLRDLYPYPDTRTMSDIDILVKEEEFEKVSEALADIGYKKISSDYKHTLFHHPEKIDIEVHTKLSGDFDSEGVKSWEASLWENIVPVNVCNQSVYSLSYEDHLLYLCVHLANHTKSLGFGLRQLCDIVLYTEKYINEINWDTFLIKAEMIGIKKFTIIIFKSCEVLLGLDSNLSILRSYDNNDDNLSILINDIISGGVFGTRDSVRVINGYYFSKFKGKKEKIAGKTNHTINIMFPPYSVMKQRYTYINNIPLLLPIAWVHRALRNLLKKNKVFQGKNNFKVISKSHEEYKERYKLLKWLGLI